MKKQYEDEIKLLKIEIEKYKVQFKDYKSKEEWLREIQTIKTEYERKSK
jgi:hypothetical protein